MPGSRTGQLIQRVRSRIEKSSGEHRKTLEKLLADLQQGKTDQVEAKLQQLSNEDW